MTPMQRRKAAAVEKAVKAITAVARHDEREERLRREAMAATLDEWLAKLSESERAPIFKGLEKLATVRNRRLIQGHRARPATLPTASADTEN